ncbi:MAG: hypothetical protein KF773_09820 [Deltaproteobacteria bacterium]|nr:hypothetical protein [Deltaproteobacteria bacterium]MCW5801608.1 hypothetical protein [Deltaproteobacteria bacterium]
MRMRTCLPPLLAIALGACTKGQDAGKEEAKKEAEAEEKERAKNSPPAAKLATPVPRGKKVPCARLIDVAAFQAVLEEKEPIIIKDKREAESAAACGIYRGGKPPSAEESQKILKEKGRLGVMPQDEICDVVAYCWTIESHDTMKKWCNDKKPTGVGPMIKNSDDESLGHYACMQTMMVGKYDVNNFRFFDEDTKCILQIRGGGSQVDNDIIRKCAKTARDTITPKRIVPGEATPEELAAASGAGSGSSAGSGSGGK